MERVHKIAEMGTSVILNLIYVLCVINLVVYATVLKTPCVMLVMTVGTSIAIAVSNVKINAANAQDQLTPNAKPVTRTTSLTHQQLAMKHAQITIMETLTAGCVKIVISSVSYVMELVILSARLVMRIIS